MSLTKNVLLFFNEKNNEKDSDDFWLRKVINFGTIDTSPLTEVRFASFLSGGFITAIVVNQPKRKLAKRTSVHWLIENFYLVKKQNKENFRNSGIQEL